MRSRARALVVSLVLLVSLVRVAAGAGSATADTLVVRAERLFPVSGPVVEDGVVVARDGRIVAAGPAGAVDWPADAPVVRAAVAVPGLIDAQSSVGISGLRNVSAVLDQDENTAPDQADLRAIDAFDPRAPLLRYLLEHGVTLVQVGPGPAVPIAGQAGLFRTHGDSADAMAVRSPSALVINLGEIPKHTFGSKGEFPSTRMGTAALIRRRLARARDAGGPGAWFGRDASDDPGLAVLRRVVDGDLPALFVADRADDIETAARIAREFDLEGWIAGAAEADRTLDAVRDSGLGILLGPVMARPTSLEREYASFETAGRLAEAGMPFALRSGFESYVPRSRVVLFEASVAVANGLSREDALRALTLDAARLLDVEDDYGSLEPGKVADLVLFDADPFEYTSRIVAVVADGRLVHRRSPK